MKDALGETDMTYGVQLRMGPTGGWEGSQTGMLSSNDFPNTKHNLSRHSTKTWHTLLKGQCITFDN